MRIGVRTGADAETHEPRAIRHWCRGQILGTVDGLVAFAGPSWGASKRTASLLIGMARLLLLRDDERCSVHAGPEVSDALLSQAFFADHAQLQRAVADWLAAHLDVLGAWAARRDPGHELSDSFRTRCLQSGRSPTRPSRSPTHTRWGSVPGSSRPS